MGWIKLSFVVVLMFMAYQGEAVPAKNCDNRMAMQVLGVTVKPDPIILKQGYSVTFSGTFKLWRPVSSSYRLKLTLSKKVGWISLNVPCIKNFGSCTYSGLKCEQMLPYLDVPKCPPPPGTYTLKERTMVIPKVSLPSFIKSGDYRIKAEVYDESNRRKIACAEFKVKANA